MNTMRKTSMSLLLCAASAFVASSAYAAIDISSPSAAVTLSADGSASFGDKFKANQLNAIFNDKFTFSLSSASDLNIIVHSISTKANNGLDLTSFGLYDSLNQLVVGGHKDLLNVNTGAGFEDQWSLVASNLSAGNYYFKVGGTLVSAGGAAFAGNGSVTAVPEPATYGMLLGGLGILGWVARRRQRSV